jgi:hypothetical protein
MNGKISLISVFVFPFYCALSQDSTLIKRLNRPITNCEIVATNSQDLITSYSIDQFDSITKILSVWENHCGDNEPTQRIKILLAIKKGESIDTLLDEYLQWNHYKYKSRIEYNRYAKNNEAYESNKGYYNYIPLRGKFDAWTSEIATDLLSNLQKGTSEYLACLFFSNSFAQFEIELNSKQYANNYVVKSIKGIRYDHWNNRLRISLITGIWMPLGKLETTFDPGPQFGIAFGMPVSKMLRVDIAMVFAVPQTKKPFEINADNTIKSVKSDYAIFFGGWITKEYRINDNFFFEAIGGLGLGAISTDLKKPQSNTNDRASHYQISSFDMNAGVSLRRVIFKSSSIAIQQKFHFAPYSVDRQLKTDIGNQFTTTSLIYRF